MATVVGVYCELQLVGGVGIILSGSDSASEYGSRYGNGEYYPPPPFYGSYYMKHHRHHEIFGHGFPPYNNCLDKHPMCPQLAAECCCLKDPLMMHSICPRSCNRCGFIENSLCPFDRSIYRFPY
uniref:ShKT domain-containing protein n=1 Tax=Plectus sambesii TaxID=2011161 RepID=A0A914VPX4_9BILA